MGLTSQRRGKAGQTATVYQLRLMGVQFIREIHTGMIVSNGEPVYAKRVQGDVTGVLSPSGRSVLVEVKARDRPLRWSDFEQWQRDNLTEHHEAGGYSLVSFVYYGRVFILRWPIRGFERGKSIKPDKAERLDLSRGG